MNHHHVITWCVLVFNQSRKLNCIFLFKFNLASREMITSLLIGWQFWNNSHTLGSLIITHLKTLLAIDRQHGTHHVIDHQYLCWWTQPHPRQLYSWTNCMRLLSHSRHSSGIRFQRQAEHSDAVADSQTCRLLDWMNRRRANAACYIYWAFSHARASNNYCRWNSVK